MGTSVSPCLGDHLARYFLGSGCLSPIEILQFSAKRERPLAGEETAATCVAKGNERVGSAGVVLRNTLSNTRSKTRLLTTARSPGNELGQIDKRRAHKCPPARGVTVSHGEGKLGSAGLTCDPPRAGECSARQMIRPGRASNCDSDR